MRGSKTPRLSSQDQDNLDRLASLGLDVDPATGAIMDKGAFQGAFQGGQDLNKEPDDHFGPMVESTSTTQTVSSFDKTEEEPVDGVLPAPAAEPVPEPHKVKDGEQTPEGLAKREADARKAQQELSKTQLKLEKTLGEVNKRFGDLDDQVNKRFGDLDDQINKLAALQATMGSVPSDLNPADAETVSQYRRDYPEAVGVMESIVAPFCTQLSQVREQLNAVVRQQGEFFTKVKEEEVFGGVYSQIPKERVQQITDSPAFIEWLSDQSSAIRKLYVGILNETSRYSSEDALGVFKHFSKDTGTDVGLNGSHPHAHHAPPQMDRAPALRSGSALPPVPDSRRTTVTNEETPLAKDELLNFGQLMREASPEQRETLNKRLRLTQVEFDGDATARYI